MCAVAVANTMLFPSPKIDSILYKSPASSSSPRSVPPSPRKLQPSLSPLVLRVQKQLKEVSTDTSLKRKRPARIDVPPLVSIGFDFESLKGERVDLLEEEGDGYSVYCKKGRRGGAMEDRYSAAVDIDGDSRQAFFGVFDGHGGSKVAELGANKIAKNVMDQVRRRSEDEIEEAVRDGYRITDREIAEERISGGACCVAALIRNGHLTVSNVGDCRAVLSRGGKAEALTSDHRPSREDERNRIETSGGYVDCSRGVWRIQGSLAVSRAIGDHHLKQWVISEPETRVLKLTHDCDFLILASDGLWDKVSNQEAVDAVQAVSLGVGLEEKAELFSACKKLAELSRSRGSFDDTSVIIIKLGCFL